VLELNSRRSGYVREMKAESTACLPEHPRGQNRGPDPSGTRIP